MEISQNDILQKQILQEIAKREQILKATYQNLKKLRNENELFEDVLDDYNNYYSLPTMISFNNSNITITNHLSNTPENKNNPDLYDHITFIIPEKQILHSLILTQCEDLNSSGILYHIQKSNRVIQSLSVNDVIRSHFTSSMIGNNILPYNTFLREGQYSILFYGL